MPPLLLCPPFPNPLPLFPLPFKLFKLLWLLWCIEYNRGRIRGTAPRENVRRLEPGCVEWFEFIIFAVMNATLALCIARCRCAAMANVTATLDVIGIADTVASVVGRIVDRAIVDPPWVGWIVCAVIGDIVAGSAVPAVRIADRCDGCGKVAVVQKQDHHHPWASMMPVVGTHCTMKNFLLISFPSFLVASLTSFFRLRIDCLDWVVKVI